MMVDAVLFDFDGTLGVTMEDNFAAWAYLLSAYNIILTPEEYYPLEGLPMKDLARSIFKKYGVVPPDLDQFVREKDERYLKNNQFSLYPGVFELLDHLKHRNIKSGIVTAGRSKRIEVSAGKTFLDKFDVVLTGDMYVRGKPYPDPYLQGAAKIGCAPENCIVVENAPLGIQSAKAAGMYCIAVASTLDKRYLEAADEIVTEIGALLTHPLFTATF